MAAAAVPFPEIQPGASARSTSVLSVSALVTCAGTPYAYIAGIHAGLADRTALTTAPAMFGGKSPATKDDSRRTFMFWIILGIILGGRFATSSSLCLQQDVIGGDTR